MKKLIIAAALLGAVSFAQAQSSPPGVNPDKGMTANMDCSETGMNNAGASMMKMSDSDKKTGAMKEMEMAKTAMAKNDAAGCKMHMDKAMGMMK